MSPREMISILILSAKIAPGFVLMYYGLRFVFYNEDGPNLDKIYLKYFKGKKYKRYEAFTRTVGFVLLILGAVYAYFVFWPMVRDTFFR